MSRVVEMKPQLWHTPARDAGAWRGCGGPVPIAAIPRCRRPRDPQGLGDPMRTPGGPNSPLRVSVCTLRCRSQLALVVKADRQIRQTNGRSPAGQTGGQLSPEGRGPRGHPLCPNQHAATPLRIYALQGAAQTSAPNWAGDPPLTGDRATSPPLGVPVPCRTAVAPHVDFQGAGAGAALLALREGADALVGVRLLGLLVHGGRARALPAGAVIHQVGLQVALAPVPDPAVLAREDVLCGGKGRAGGDGASAGTLRPAGWPGTPRPASPRAPAVPPSPGDSLLTTAVARMAAMPACWGSSWMSECSGAV